MCYRCKEVKPAKCFVRDKGTKSGLASACQDCNRNKILINNAKRRDAERKLDNDFTDLDKELIMVRAGYACVNCGSESDLCVDHFRPLSKGNALNIFNAIVLCRSCNSQKSAKDPEDFFTNYKIADISSEMAVVNIIKNGIA